MTDETSRIFAELIGRLPKQRPMEEQTLDDIAGKVLDAYRAVLGDDFTVQEVICASIYGCDIVDWNSINPEMQDILRALGARHPESVDIEGVSSALSEYAVEYLHEQGLTVSDEQTQLFPDLMKGIMLALEQTGVKFGNDVRQARILGLESLFAYKNWLVRYKQAFMNLNQYSLELKLTENAIKASQNALTTALVAAGDVKVDYGLRSEIIEGIIKAKIPVDYWGYDYPFVVIYETKDGKMGKIDVLREIVISLTEKADEDKLYSLLHEKKINAEHGSENLGYSGSIEALVGLPQDVTQELRANFWRGYLKRFGVDFSQNAEIILVHPIDREKVTFFYGTTDYNAQDNGVMVAFTFDERYEVKYSFVCTRDKMQKDISRAERERDEFDAAYKPLLKPMAVHDYIEKRQRLTQHRL